MINILKRIIRSTLIGNYLIYKISSYLLLLKFYNDNSEPINQEDRLIIYMADGKKYHGGLTDRINGMVFLYKFCIDNNYKFKIFFNHPFKLDEYIIPNEYNWIIESDKMIYNKRYSEPICLINCDMKYQNLLINNINNTSKKQFHVYTNQRYNKIYHQNLFNILFKPTQKLHEALIKHLQNIGNNFISISYRFQNLLGDFPERRSSALSVEKQEMLINRCLAVIPVIKRKHLNVKNILITSDSMKFRERALFYNYVYIVPGIRIHTDIIVSDDKGGYLESFLDFYLIANAEKAYSAHSKIMYGGKFAKIAAEVNNKPYEEINI